MNITEVILVTPAPISFTEVTKHNSNSLPNSHHKNSDITIENGRRGSGEGGHKMFFRISQTLEAPWLVIFASRLSDQFQSHKARRLDPYSQGSDAKQQNWSNGILHVFPPFCLIGQVLHKVPLNQIEKLLLITPSCHT